LAIAETERIVQVSRVNNGQCDISGFLCANSSFFMQCIEGEQQAVRALFARIASDPRHSDIRIMFDGDIASRSFGHWRMRVALGLEKHQAILQHYSQGAVFDPYLLSAQQCLQLLKDFAALRPL
jgi:hypothetical protein